MTGKMGGRERERRKEGEREREGEREMRAGRWSEKKNSQTQCFSLCFGSGLLSLSLLLQFLTPCTTWLARRKFGGLSNYLLIIDARVSLPFRLGLAFANKLETRIRGKGT